MLSQPLLDEKHINDDLHCLGREALDEMLTLFKASSADQIAALVQISSDGPGLLHALKGSSASMGCIALSQRCKQLELDGLNGDSYQSLKQLWQASISALELILTH
jgi:two-component system sensor histidine kinase TorS